MNGSTCADYTLNSTDYTKKQNKSIFWLRQVRGFPVLLNKMVKMWSPCTKTWYDWERAVRQVGKEQESTGKWVTFVLSISFFKEKIENAHFLYSSRKVTFQSLTVLIFKSWLPSSVCFYLLVLPYCMIPCNIIPYNA